MHLRRIQCRDTEEMLPGDCSLASRLPVLPPVRAAHRTPVWSAHFPELRLPLHHNFLCPAQGFAMTTKEISLLNVNVCVCFFLKQHTVAPKLPTIISFKNMYLEALNCLGLKVHLHTAFFYCYQKSTKL